jgi:hypothetical protein
MLKKIEMDLLTNNSATANMKPKMMRPNAEVEKFLNPKNLVHAIAANNPEGFFEAAKKKGIELRDGNDMYQLIEMIVDGQDGEMLKSILDEMEYKPEEASEQTARNMVEALKILNQ